jgi:hypothetical protein
MRLWSTRRHRALNHPGAASTTIFSLLPLRPGSQWTVAELVRQYEGELMQIRLWEMFQQDLDHAGESLLIYELDELGRPLFLCTCGVKTPCSELTWSHAQNDPLIERRECVVMLKPRRRSCHSFRTFPVVRCSTKRPHYATDLTTTKLNELRNSVGWLKPDDEAQVAEWRRKFGNRLTLVQVTSDISARCKNH